MEGKWFADSDEGVLLHAAAHYPDGEGLVVSAEVPQELFARLFRLPDLDHFGPATYLDMIELDGIIPLFEAHRE